MGETVSRDLPDVVNYTRLHYEGSCVIRYGNVTFLEQKFMWADSSLFDVFTLQFVAGDPRTSLVRPNSVVIVESAARKYFGSQNPIGKS